MVKNDDDIEFVNEETRTKKSRRETMPSETCSNSNFTSSHKSDIIVDSEPMYNKLQKKSTDKIEDTRVYSKTPIEHNNLERTTGFRNYRDVVAEREHFTPYIRDESFSIIDMLFNGIDRPKQQQVRYVSRVPHQNNYRPFY
ncbi:hypothetical protein AKO1_015656 [Acrasis kona]|uniref:Uncharacterized protein n=1 Tax=Acrasis kona TaxID=1008807 RepID=A0AAW2ZID7_9EUKA